MAENASPLGFGAGARLRPVPPPPENLSTERESPSNQSTTQPPPEDPQNLTDRLKARVENLREMGRGRKPPLGSPEGRQHLASPRSSRGSSDESRFVDASALGVHEVTTFVDWGLSKRFGDADFVATAEECYAIAAPLAGYLLDRIPEEGPLAEIVERAGLIGAGIAAAKWLARAVLMKKPGGRSEVEALHDRAVDRLVNARSRAGDAVRTAAESDEGDEPVVSRSYSEMIGLDDVGPA